jgi:hypothetical protein
MNRRAILARIKARHGLATPVPVEAKTVKKDLGKIAMKDLDSGLVVKEFANIDEAVAEGYNKPNIVGAIKGNKKYKGHFWTAENELT